MGGLGRGAGNCPMELLLGFLGESEHRLPAALVGVDEVIAPLRADPGWRFDLPYMITGLDNRPPCRAIAFNAAGMRSKIGEFYEACTAESKAALLASPSATTRRIS